MNDSDASKNIIDAITCLIFLISIWFVASPWHLFNIPRGKYAFILIIVISLATLLYSSWTRKPKDEREIIHTLISAKLSYQVGVWILATALVVQIINRNIDIWIVIALSVSVIARTIGLIYSRQNK